MFCIVSLVVITPKKWERERDTEREREEEEGGGGGHERKSWKKSKEKKRKKRNKKEGRRKGKRNTWTEKVKGAQRKANLERKKVDIRISVWGMLKFDIPINNIPVGMLSRNYTRLELRGNVI